MASGLCSGRMRHRMACGSGALPPRPWLQIASSGRQEASLCFKTPAPLEASMAMPPGSPPVPRDNQLYEDSLKLTVNKNIEDIRILLLWAQEADAMRDKIQHSQQALTYLADVVETLRELRGSE